MHYTPQEEDRIRAEIDAAKAERSSASAPSETAWQPRSLALATGSGSDSVEAAKAFVGTNEIAKCLRTLEPGYGYMEVSFGPRRATITRVEHRAQSPNTK